MFEDYAFMHLSSLRLETAPCLILWMALWAIVLGGCGAKQIPEPEDSVQDVATIMHYSQERSQDVHAARAQAVMEYYGEEGRVRIRQALVVREPGDVRLETLSPFQSTLSVLITNSEQLVYYDLADERLFHGAPTARNLNKLIPLWLSPSDIVRVVLGGLPVDMVPVDPQDWAMAWDGHRGEWKLTSTSQDGGEMHLWLRHHSWALAGADMVDKQKRIVWEIRTRDFQPISQDDIQTEYPQRIRFLMPQEQIDVSLHIQDYSLNPRVSDALFELDLPDVDTIDLDAR